MVSKSITKQQVVAAFDFHLSACYCAFYFGRLDSWTKSLATSDIKVL